MLRASWKQCLRAWRSKTQAEHRIVPEAMIQRIHTYSHTRGGRRIDCGVGFESRASLEEATCVYTLSRKERAAPSPRTPSRLETPLSDWRNKMGSKCRKDSIRRDRY